MAIISTGICFAILLFAPFTILKQMSFFCLTGLISSFLTTIAVYPYIKLPANRGNVRFTKGFSKVIVKMEQKWVGRTVIIFLFAFSIISIAVFHKNVKVKNNLLTLYDMKGRLLQDEITASQVIQYTPGGWYIVSGDTEDEALANEEKLRRSFEKMTGGVLLRSDRQQRRNEHYEHQPLHSVTSIPSFSTGTTGQVSIRNAKHISSAAPRRCSRCTCVALLQ